MKFDKEKENNGNVPMFTIGAMAQALDVHIRTLRIYDEQGLVVPERTKYNRRLYTQNDLEKARFIMLLTRNFAVNIMGVKIILKLLEATKIKPELYMDYMQTIAKSLNINEEIQQDNQNMISKRCKGYKSALKK
ncbi:MAG: MerR family transcriptional regulator [Cyanobacteria bacterium SIG30]|nr:MerR family transcriptional regulator [Cyanobacteria bacterium SIG30]